MPRRKRATWGADEQAGPGRRRLRCWADEHDGRGYARHSRTMGGTRRQGDEELARLRVAHSADAPVPTVGQAWETWVRPEMEGRVESGEMARTTYVNYVSRWSRHVAPRFAGVPVTDVRPADVQDWLSGLTRSMAGVSLIVLRQILSECVMRELVDRNVADVRCRMPRAGETRSKGVYALGQLVRAPGAVRGTPAYLPRRPVRPRLLPRRGVAGGARGPRRGATGG